LPAVARSPLSGLPRNIQQDALGAGLSITEYAREGKSVEEIRGLWRWVWKKLTVESAAYEPPQLRAAASAELFDVEAAGGVARISRRSIRAIRYSPRT